MGQVQAEPQPVREADPLSVGDIATGIMLGLWGFLITLGLALLLVARMRGREISW